MVLNVRDAKEEMEFLIEFRDRTEKEMKETEGRLGFRSRLLRERLKSLSDEITARNSSEEETVAAKTAAFEEVVSLFR